MRHEEQGQIWCCCLMWARSAPVQEQDMSFSLVCLLARVPSSQKNTPPRTAPPTKPKTNKHSVAVVRAEAAMLVEAAEDAATDAMQRADELAAQIEDLERRLVVATAGKD